MSIPRNFYKTVLCSLEFNNSFLDSLGSDEDSGNEDVLDMEYTEAEAEELKRNAEVRDILLPERPWAGCQHCFCSAPSQAPLSVSIALISAPVAVIKWLSLSLSFALHFFQDSKQNETETEIHPDHLTCG